MLHGQEHFVIKKNIYKAIKVNIYFFPSSVRWTQSQVIQRMSCRQKLLSSAGSWAATPPVSLRSQVAETGRSTPPFRRESPGSTTRQPQMLSAFKSGSFWIGISPSLEESWVSGTRTQRVLIREIFFLQEEECNWPCNFIYLKPARRAETFLACHMVHIYV